MTSLETGDHMRLTPGAGKDPEAALQDGIEMAIAAGGDVSITVCNGRHEWCAKETSCADCLHAHVDGEGSVF